MTLWGRKPPATNKLRVEGRRKEVNIHMGDFRCLKEINPESHPGVFFGRGYVYEENSMACEQCECVSQCRREETDERTEGE
jgi:uncharacterized Zn-finger protein